MKEILTCTESLLLNIKTRQNNLKELSAYLSELESQMSLIFAASPDIIVLLDKDAHIVKISDAVFPILGYKRSELIGKCLWDFIAVYDLDKTKNHINLLQQGDITKINGNNPLINHWIAKSGKLVKLIWRLALYNEQNSQIVGIASDISSFDNNQNYCAKLLQRAVDLSADGIAVTDSYSKGNEIVYVNDAFVKMTGYSQQELIGKNCKFLQTEECKHSRAISTLRDSVKTGKGCDILLQNVKKSGEIFYNKLTVSVVTEGGEPINHLWISKDVTPEIGIKYEWSPYTERGFHLLR
jgi:PAS domain S-box-containing protein